MILLGQLAALGAAMAWTITSLFDEHFTKGVWAPSVNFLRLNLGLVFVSLLSLMVSGEVLVVPAETEGAIWLILSGLIAFAVGDNFLILAFQTIGARITMLIFSISPIMTAVAGYLIFGETLSPLNFLGMFLTLSGLVLVITAKSDTGQKQYSPIGVQAALLAEFADRAGVSKQAVYSRLNKGLNPYLKMLNGVKHVDSTALEFFVQEVVQPIQPQVEHVEQGMIDLLREELHQKNRQLEKKDEQIATLQKLLDQEQQLHATASKRILLLEGGKEESNSKERGITENEKEEKQVSSSAKKWFEFWK